MRFRWFFLGAAMFITVSCTITFGEANTPRINNFAARPQKVCNAPSVVDLDYSLSEGTDGRIRSGGDGTINNVTGSGSTSRNVETLPTTFTLTATKAGNSIERSVTVNRMTGIDVVGLGGLATCTASGLYVFTNVVSNEIYSYSSDVIIKKLWNRSGFEIGVTGPTGDQVIIPALSSSDGLNGKKLFGTWIINTVALSPCTPPGGELPTSTQPIGLDAEVGCQ